MKRIVLTIIICSVMFAVGFNRLVYVCNPAQADTEQKALVVIYGYHNDRFDIDDALASTWATTKVSYGYANARPLWSEEYIISSNSISSETLADLKNKAIAKNQQTTKAGMAVIHQVVILP